MNDEEIIEVLWRDLLEKTDRTSPAEYPDMALITFDEFKSFLSVGKQSKQLMNEATNNLVEATKALVESIKFDDSGFNGKGGNGGLISSSTIRKTDITRIALSTYEKVLKHEQSNVSPLE